MTLNIFFDKKFEQLVNELEVPAFGRAFSAQELATIRENAKSVLFGNPEEAAARAFHNLVVLNQKIPIEQRLEMCFKQLTRLKLWHFNGNVNPDLHFNIRPSFEKLLSEYVGKSYEDNYCEALGQLGVVVPITHDTLRFLALSYLYHGKKFSTSADVEALSFCLNVVAKDSEKYSTCIAKTGLRLNELLQQAEQGDAPAQFLLGLMYISTEDENQAAAWFQKAAEQGHAGAQWNMGFFCSHGLGVVEDNVEAHKWWSLSLENGNAKAGQSIETVETLLTREQIAEAKHRASEWLRAHGKLAV